MSTIPPAEDAREVFACTLYRLFAPIEQNFMISPAAVMKVLFVLSQGAHESLANEIYWDLGIKHLDNDAIMDLTTNKDVANAGMQMNAVQYLIDSMNAPIEQRSLIEFMRNDFRELGDIVSLKNYFVHKAKFTFKADYANFAKSYFGFQLLRKEDVQAKMQLIDLRFSDCLSTWDLDLFGLVEFNFMCKPPFEMYEDGSLGAYGSFKYGLLGDTAGANFCAEVVEIPLESSKNANLTMLVFLPSDLTTLAKRSLGIDYTHFDEIAKILSLKVVDIKLPSMTMQKKCNLSDHFAEHANNGLRDCFTEPVILSRMFQNREAIEIGNYFQHTSLNLTAARANKPASDRTDKSTDIPFDVRRRSFFYVIKSKKVIYVMGHFCKEEHPEVRERKRNSLRRSIANQRKLELEEPIRPGNSKQQISESKNEEDTNSLRDSLKFASQLKREKEKKDASKLPSQLSKEKKENMDSKKKLRDNESGQDLGKNIISDSLKFRSQLKKEKEENKAATRDPKKSLRDNESGQDLDRNSLRDSLKFASQLKREKEEKDASKLPSQRSKEKEENKAATIDSSKKENEKSSKPKETNDEEEKTNKDTSENKQSALSGTSVKEKDQEKKSETEEADSVEESEVESVKSKVDAKESLEETKEKSNDEKDDKKSVANKKETNKSNEESEDENEDENDDDEVDDDDDEDEDDDKSSEDEQKDSKKKKKK